MVVRHWLSLCRRHGATVLWLGVILVLVLSLIRNLMRVQSDVRLDALRRQGLPVNLAEVNAYYSPVPDSENLGLACEQVFRAMPANQELETWWRGTNAVLRGQAGLSPQTLDYLAAVLGTNQAALDLLHALPASDRCRYSLDLTQGSVAPLPHLSALKEAVALLVMEAVVDAAAGEPDSAVAAMTIAGRVADSLVQEPVMITYLVRGAAWTRIVAGLEQIVSTTSLSEAQLASLQALVAKGEKNTNPTRALIGERAFGLAFFSDKQEQARVFGNHQRLLANVVFGASTAAGVLRRDRAYYLDYMGAAQEVASQPFPARFQRGQAAAGNMPTNRLFIVSRILLPALGRFFERDAQLVARLRVAQTALASERYRLAHGGVLPDRLAALVPAYLEMNPTDPIDGAPLRLKRQAQGYVVYSVGPDGKDDTSGTTAPAKSSSTADIVFEVRR